MGSKSAIGIGNGICFKQVRDKGGGSYIDPLVRDSIVGLWKFDQNTNESPTRNIIKNTIKDKGGDLELLNFGYKLNSGYGKYEEDFTTWYGVTGVLQTSSKIEITDGFKHNWAINKRSGDATINSSKVLIKGIPESGYLQYCYFESEDATKKTSIYIYMKMVSILYLIVL